MTVFQDKANLIWEVADLLRGDYKQSDYGKVILPMTVLRRLDCVLAKTKDKVLAYLPKIEKLSDSSKDVTLNKIAGQNFHNRSQFDFTKLVADPNNIAANLRNYINGYSASAREIIEYFLTLTFSMSEERKQGNLVLKCLSFILKMYEILSFQNLDIESGRVRKEIM
jgi:type I restriction enzyme M protein